MDSITPVAATPQIAATAPDKSCPTCGRRMQVLSVSASTYTYVCYAHTLQNSDIAEPFYVNVHFKSVGPDSKIKEMK